MTSRSGIDYFCPLKLKCTLVRRFDQARVHQCRDVPGLAERLIDHGWKLRTLVGLDQHQLRPSDLALNFLFTENYPLHGAFFIVFTDRRLRNGTGFSGGNRIGGGLRPPFAGLCGNCIGSRKHGDSNK